MKKYVCSVCGYVYDPAVGDPDSGIAPGTAWEDTNISSLTSNSTTTTCCTSTEVCKCSTNNSNH